MSLGLLDINPVLEDTSPVFTTGLTPSPERSNQFPTARSARDLRRFKEPI
jgi:hypothetical protein